jgi:ankyrin repeat protein
VYGEKLCGLATAAVFQQDGSTALHHAANEIADCLNALKFLLEKGADPSISRNDGCLPIHLVARHKSQEAVEGLESLLASIDDDTTCLNAKSRAGHTPLQLVALHTEFGYNSLKMIELLSRCANIDLNCPDNNSRTPLISLAMRLNEQTGQSVVKAIKFLLQEGVDCDHKDVYGSTALHYLVDNGADICIKDEVGKTIPDILFDKWVKYQVKSRNVLSTTILTAHVIRRISDDELQGISRNGWQPLSIAIRAQNE